MYYYLRRRSDLFPQFMLFLLFLLGFGTLFHELGHVIVAKIQGAQVESFQIFGSQLYPSFGAAPFNGTFASSEFSYLDYSPEAEAFRLLGGVGMTFLISVVSSVLTSFLKLRNIYLRMMLLGFFLYFLDLVSYTFLPQFGFGHVGLGILRICPPEGCDFSEPLRAAVLLGWNEIWFQVGVGILAFSAITLQIFSMVISKKRMARQYQQP